MSRKTIFKCDRCGKVNDDNAELRLYNVAVGVSEIKYNSYAENIFLLKDLQNRQEEWCEKCLKDVGMSYSRETIEAPKDGFPTLEELVREIVREEANKVMNGG